MSKKKSRSNVKHPYFVKHLNSRIKQEYLDIDYIDKLSEEEKDFYNKFLGEYYAADLDFQDLEKNMHNNKELKKDCTDRNNARNRCAYGISKSGVPNENLEKNMNRDEIVIDEEALNSMIDYKKSTKED